MKTRQPRSDVQPGFFVPMALAPGLVASFGITLLAAAVLALMVALANLGERPLLLSINFLYLVSIAVGGAFSARFATVRGWLHGAACGIAYVIAAFALGSLAFPRVVSAGLLPRQLLLGVAAGALGGMVGLNL